MMEFMMARVSACICAALIIGLMFAPVTNTLMENANDMTQDNCNALGEAMDRFMYGDAETAILFMNIYLPAENSSISIHGKVLELRSSDESYFYTLGNDTETDREAYCSSDTIELTKENGILNIRLLNDA